MENRENFCQKVAMQLTVLIVVVDQEAQSLFLPTFSRALDK
jgi:hypothetical protein